jgi:lipoic acid synthetase
MTISTDCERSNKLPFWLRRRIPRVSECSRIEQVVGKYHLHTVCREALCPNRAECYGRGKATFIILGDTCTRECRFCAVTKGIPRSVDGEEPENLARAVSELGLSHVIVTSVTRDDLPDGGSGHYAAVIRALKRLEPVPVIEVLVPDFSGSEKALETVLEAGPSILSHNLETVERLYGTLRRGADYDRSLQLLKSAKTIDEEVMTKSALILGFGETKDEVIEAFRDLRLAGCDFLAVGQYLRPGAQQVPVVEYIPPEDFSILEKIACEIGFLEVAAGPLMRSSYQENSLASPRTAV